jgi:hypothetical protein
MQTLRRHDVRPEQSEQRRQCRRAGTHPIRQRGDVEIDALTRVGLALAVAAAAVVASGLPKQLLAASDEIRPFRIDVPEQDLVDLRRRLAATRWPDKETVADDTQGVPLAIEAVRRIDAIFDAERTINGLPPDQRRAVRQERIAVPVDELQSWMREVRGKMSRHADVAKAIDYMLKRWGSFSRFLDDGRVCLTNNAAERALRGIALGRKAWLFAGSDRGGERAAAMYSLIVTAKLNNVDPRAWLADVLNRINDHPASRLDELLPWNCRAAAAEPIAA